MKRRSLIGIVFLISVPVVRAQIYCGVHGTCCECAPPDDCPADCPLDAQWVLHPSATECLSDTCARGACCLPGNNCDETTEAGCTFLGGLWFSLNQECVPGSSCPPVPTVSEWGLVILGLLLLIAGSRLIGLRNRSPA